MGERDQQNQHSKQSTRGKTRGVQERPAPRKSSKTPARRSTRPQRSQESSPSRPEKAPLPDATELVSQLNGHMTQLLGELAHGKSDRLQQYLAFAARFHHYSRGNQWLIQAQMPTATRVASYSKWQEEGYQVAAGVRGIRILAPSKRRIQPESKAEPPEDPTEEARRQTPEASPQDKKAATVVRFVAVSVFDVSQLTPDKRPPEFFTPLEGDADALYERIVEAATADGFIVEQSEYTRGAEGYSSGRRIVTRSDLASTNRALTAIHEYTHGLLHQGVHPLAHDARTERNLAQVPVSIKECHAEATAYVVAQHFGLDNPFSSDYLLHWGTTPETLRNELNVVLGAASHIITSIEGNRGEGSPDPLVQ